MLLGTTPKTGVGFIAKKKTLYYRKSCRTEIKKTVALIERQNTKMIMNDTQLTTIFTGGHTEVVRMLIEASADVNVKQSGLLTPLHLAAKGQSSLFFLVKMQ